MSVLPREIILEQLITWSPKVIENLDTHKPDGIQCLLACRLAGGRLKAMVDIVLRGKLTLHLGQSYEEGTRRMKSILEGGIPEHFLACYGTLVLDAQLIDPKLPQGTINHGSFTTVNQPELEPDELIRFIFDAAKILRKLGPHLHSMTLISKYADSGPYYMGIKFTDRFFRVSAILLLYSSTRGYLPLLKDLKMSMQKEWYVCYLAEDCVYDAKLEAVLDKDEFGDGLGVGRVPEYILKKKTWAPRFMGGIPASAWDKWPDHRPIPLLARLDTLRVPDVVPEQMLRGLRLRLSESAKLETFMTLPWNATIWPGSDPLKHRRREMEEAGGL